MGEFGDLGEDLADGEEPGHDAAGGRAAEDADLRHEGFEAAFAVVGEGMRGFGEPTSVGEQEPRGSVGRPPRSRGRQR